MTAKDSRRSSPLSARMTAGLMPMFALAAACLWSHPAAADFRLCNNTSSRVGIALGYKDAEGWTTEGWWNVSSRSCETLLRGTLVARFYYIFEVDTGEQRAWTVQLTESSEQPAQRVPGIPGTVGPGGNLPGMPNAPGGAPGLPNPPGGSAPGTSGLPPATAPGTKP